LISFVFIVISRLLSEAMDNKRAALASPAALPERIAGLSLRDNKLFITH
jgi:hypothetical protein